MKLTSNKPEVVYTLTLNNTEAYMLTRVLASSDPDYYGATTNAFVSPLLHVLENR